MFRILNQKSQIFWFSSLNHLSGKTGQNEMGVRRNINALEGNERKQFFWCMKMLGILPSFKALRNRYFISRGYKGDPNKEVQLN